MIEKLILEIDDECDLWIWSALSESSLASLLINRIELCAIYIYIYIYIYISMSVSRFLLKVFNFPSLSFQVLFLLDYASSLLIMELIFFKKFFFLTCTLFRILHNVLYSIIHFLEYLLYLYLVLNAFLCTYFLLILVLPVLYESILIVLIIILDIYTSFLYFYWLGFGLFV